MSSNSSFSSVNEKLFRAAFILSLFTILYNLAEGIMATFLGFEDEALTLFGFGLDSFIEVISAVGIAHMIIRIARSDESGRDQFEKTALRITGFSFYALCGVLAAMAMQRVVSHENPSTTCWGIVISLISIIVMLVTIYWKIYLGKALHSDALIADANCAKVCVYMSVVLLASSLLYEFFRMSYVDVLGTCGIIYFSFKEGKECFEKAKGLDHCGCDH